MLNPYNFSSPVSDINLLFGRASELLSIRYYLDQGNLSKNPISIALIGDRASGKTSIINATEEIANELEYIPVRIDLNESDVEGDDRFFYKLIDALVYEACSKGFFGGIGGGYYAEYLTSVSGVSTESKYCPLTFPKVYGQLSKNSPGSYVNDNIITRDLNSIRNEVGKNIIFLIDEANLISKNLSILQKLRNIIMRIKGFSILIAGTDTIFPSIDEVFSPIARQFVKIQVGPFKSAVDTADCVLRPLEINDEISRIKVSENTINEVHNMTYGKPYEIQFVCHTLFKRAIDNNSDEMRISTETMRDIMQQLVSLSARENSNFIDFMLKMSPDELRLARIIESYVDGVSEEILVGHMRLFFSYNDVQIHEMNGNVARLLEHEIIKHEGNRMYFAGDAFEAIYLKYLGKQSHGDYFPPDSASNVWYSRIIFQLLHGFNSDFSRFTVAPSIDFFSEITRIIGFINSNKGSELRSPYETELLRELYDSAFHFKEGEKPTFINVRVRFFNVDVSFIIVKLRTKDDQMIEITRRLEKMKQKIIRAGGTLRYESKMLPLPQRSRLIQAVLDTEDISLANSAAAVHERAIYDLHTDNSGLLRKAVDTHISAVMRYSDSLDGD